MSKIITIKSCEQCKFVWLYLGVDECCGLLSRKPIPIDGDSIPSWCPLNDATPENIKTEEQIVKESKGEV